MKTQEPQVIHILEVDPSMFSIVPARALDMGIGRENVLSLTKRYRAIAGINGGFFSIGGTYDGISRGILKIDQKWYGLPIKPRGAIGWKKNQKTQIFDRLLASATIEINGYTIIADGINQPRKENEIILFSSDFGFTTLTNPDGYEILIENNHIKEMSYQGSSSIPHQGWVLSIGKERMSEIPSSLLHHNETAVVQIEIMPQSNTKEKSNDWISCDYILGGCPLLICDGQQITDFSPEKTIESFLSVQHARTAVGILPDGKWIFVVVDGKNVHYSVGMTIDELTEFMGSLGCVHALNLDGGGSSTMVFDSKIVNKPVGDEDYDNNQQKIRDVSDAIIIIPK